MDNYRRQIASFCELVDEAEDCSLHDCVSTCNTNRPELSACVELLSSGGGGDNVELLFPVNLIADWVG